MQKGPAWVQDYAGWLRGHPLQPVNLHGSALCLQLIFLSSLPCDLQRSQLLGCSATGTDLFLISLNQELLHCFSGWTIRSSPL